MVDLVTDMTGGLQVRGAHLTQVLVVVVPVK
jgi:hypothetical protein